MPQCKKSFCKVPEVIILLYYLYLNNNINNLIIIIGKCAHDLFYYIESFSEINKYFKLKITSLRGRRGSALCVQTIGELILHTSLADVNILLKRVNKRGSATPKCAYTTQKERDEGRLIESQNRTGRSISVAMTVLFSD